MADRTATVVVVGGGPAGLMAAEAAARTGVRVEVFDAMPSVGRKFLLAGRGGLNLTHSEPLPAFAARYGGRAERMRRFLEAFPPEETRRWADGLGIATFVGTSGRVFPDDFKAAPLLRAWLRRLRAGGVVFHVRRRWTGFAEDGGLVFRDDAGAETTVRADAAVLALGGASWPKMGSDGAWVPILRDAGVTVRTLKPANCGFLAAWSPAFAARFAGTPLKNVALGLGERRVKGELVISDYGVEGGAVYGLSAALRDAVEADGVAVALLDLKPDLSPGQVAARLAEPRRRASLANFLRKALRLPPVAYPLLRECSGPEDLADPRRLAGLIKALPLRLTGTRPIEEAISSAGGVAFEDLDADLMVMRRPGLFVAGEMLDWEAPTGGYLLQGCLSTGRWAGEAAARHALRA